MLNRIERQIRDTEKRADVILTDIMTTADANISFYLQCVIDRQIWRIIDTTVNQFHAKLKNDIFSILGYEYFVLRS